jgi:CHAT domain-containing protein
MIATAADATEARFREQAPSADVLHLATHGIMDDTSPLYSHVMLTKSGASGASGASRTDVDGRIEGRELLNMRLKADLVVLSACETARGHVANGEGMLGMSWALFAAGASTAALSLWQVDSASTTELMTAFHRGRQLSAKTPAPTAQAMRAAQREILANPEYRHPFYWAGFIVVGVP